jgi:Tfp pilus assembly protein PilP
MRAIILSLALAAAGSASARAQEPTSPGTAPAAAPQTQPAPGSSAGLPAPPANFEYSADGRRDPFVSLVNRGTNTGAGQPTGTRPDSVAGVAVDEVIVRGIVQSRGGWVAMVGAPNGRTYSVRPGDRLLDGNVHSINAQAVVLLQEVSDPLSLQKQREVRKYLRGGIK